MTDTPLRALIGLSALALTLALVVARVPLEALPHVTDEVVYTLQARLFAAGMRTGPAGDNASMLLYPFWVTEPGSYGVFPPGWPALLGVGELLRAPWLVNPLLAATLPPLTWLLAVRLGERPRALLAAAVVALSPAVLLLAGTRMAHTSVLVALLALAVCVLGAGRRHELLLGGLALGYVVAARPYDAALIGLPLSGWGLWRHRLGAWPLLLGPAAATTLLALDNLALTGSVHTFPVGPWFDAWVADWGRPAGCNRLGFGADIGCSAVFGSWGHTPAKAARIAWETLLRQDRLLLGVPGSLLLLLPGAWALRRKAWLLLPIPLVVLGYALYWSPGAAYGPRFWHPLYLVLPLLTAAGLQLLLERWAWVPVALLPIAGGSMLLPELASSYWCVDGSLVELLEAEGEDHGVVFLDARGEPRLGEWPALGKVHCDALLEAGDGFLLLDPSRPSGGLQPRHALPTLEMTRAYMEALHPGQPAWISTVDLATGERDLVRVPLE